jgi:hypothetical protein
VKHRIYVNLLLLAWALTAARVAFASTLTQDVFSWDYSSLMWGGIAGLLGGTLRTIFTLATDSRVVFSILKESIKDLIVSMIAGGVAYCILLAVESRWPGFITREIRMVVIVAAGWMRVAFFNGLDRIVTRWIDQKTRLPDAPPQAPISAAVPLSDKGQTP